MTERESGNGEVQPEKPGLRESLKKIGVCALALATGGSLAYDAVKHRNPLKPIDELQNILKGEALCPAVPFRYLRIVQADTRRPELPFVHQVQESGNSGIEPTLMSPDKHNSSFLHRQAEQSGLHLTNYLEYLDRLNKTTSLNEALGVLNGLTHQYGFTVGIPDKLGSEDIPQAKVVGSNIIRLDVFKGTAGDFIMALGMMPVEVVRYSELREVKLVQLPPSVGGVDSPSEGIIYWPVSDDGLPFSFQTAFLHELGHQLDGQMCKISGMNNDPSFVKLNQPDFRYEKEYETMPNPNVWDAAATNVREDKAIEYSYLFQGLWSGPSVLKNKTEYLLARLEEHVPGTANYFTGINLHSSPELHGG